MPDDQGILIPLRLNQADPGNLHDPDGDVSFGWDSRRSAVSSTCRHGATVMVQFSRPARLSDPGRFQGHLDGDESVSAA